MYPLHSEAAEAFIEAEFSTGEMFADWALEARAGYRRERLAFNARKACDAITRFLPRSAFDPEKQLNFEARLANLQRKLHALDEEAA